ncbi:MAG TPA: hypothetical protein P5087_06220 [Eubacteriales bacterium]|nr:hypothetical protein [Eubacteriales bacterium]
MEMLLLAFAAMMLLGQKQTEKKQSNFFDGIGDLGILGDGAKNLMDSFTKLNGDGDKTSVIMELISNPLVFNLLKNSLFKDKSKETSTDEKPSTEEKASEYAPSEETNKADTIHKEEEDVSYEQKIKDAANAVKKSDITQKQTETEEEFKSYGETFSEEAKEFFRPIEKIAGLEVSKELYKLYDGWYLRNKSN